METGLCPLPIAPCRHGHSEVLRCLVSEAGGDMETREDWFQNTVLLTALEYGEVMEAKNIAPLKMQK